jgi:RND family efflux transporter MFP subunit
MPVRSPLHRLLPLLCVVTLPVILSTNACAELKTAVVARGGDGGAYRAEAVIEAVRHAELAAQVPGRVTAVPAKAGARVAAGAELVLIDARAAQDQQVAARAQLDAAQRDYERSRELFAQNYISKAAMDRAEAQYRVARAQAGVAGTQSDFHRIAAPYAGVVAKVHAEVGDMAQPGLPLLSFYDPLQLRATAQLPESVAAAIDTNAGARIELNDARTPLAATSVEVLPTVDPVAHTREVRVTLPADAQAIPGGFARVLLPLRGGDGAKVVAPLSIPVSAVVTRAEFQGVYVVADKGRVQLRQVRLGRRSGDRVEVLAGLREGERIALEPLVALRMKQTQKESADE